MKSAWRGVTDVTRLVRAAGYSLKGLKAAWREVAFRQEVLLFVVLAPLAAWLGEDGLERALLIASLVLVLIVELMNSALEAVVNRFSQRRHALAGRAKDMGSAAVLLAVLLALLVWGVVLLP